jgi:hypothetical protein
LQPTQWNLISFPLDLGDPIPSDVIGPNLIAIFGWTGSGYSSPTTVEAKKGYWVLVSVAVTDRQIIGLAPADGTAAHLATGWNLVGPRGNPRGGAQSKPPPPAWAIACFGWTGTGYTVPASCLEGSGYWILATEAGDLWP